MEGRECPNQHYQSTNLFYVRNRLKGCLDNNIPAAYGGYVSFGKPSHVHTLGLILPPEQYYALHPEYYALVNGERYANVGRDIIHPLPHANNTSVRSKLESWKNITSNDLIFWDYAVNYFLNPPMPRAG